MKGTIIYYGGFALPDKNASANRVVSNGKLFNSLGYETVFLGACYDEERSEMCQISENMFEEPHPATSSDWLKQILNFSNLKKLSEEYESLKMVLLYNVPFITLVLAKMYFSKKGIAVAYDCTEWTQFTEGSFLKKAFKYVDEFFVRNFTHRVADKVIVISKMMERKYKSDKKLLKLPPLVDINDDIWHQQAVEKPEEIVFCFAGFPGGNKDYLDRVVEAFNCLDNSNVALKIIGVTEGEFKELYPDTKIADNKHICFEGRVSHSEAIKNVLNCDCYIFIRPSDRRNNAGFPTKFAESFTCGVPIITTDVSDIKDFLKLSPNCVLVNDTDVQSIKDAMLCVIKNNKRKEACLNTSFHYEQYKNQANEWLD